MAAAAVPMWRAYGVLITLSMGGLILVTNEILPFGLINVMAGDLGVSQSSIGLLVTGYAIVIVLASIPLAYVTRSVPRRVLFAVTFATWAVGAAVAATADDYRMLLVARLITAFSQALYWAVATATVAGLFPPEVRGKAVSRMLIGPSTAGLAGLPTLTWLGQNTDWRIPFWILAGVGLAVAVASAVLIPTYRPSEGAAARGSHPHLRRFVMLLGITMFGVLGLMMVFTYITPFLNEVAGFSESTIPLLLVAQGAVGMITMVAIGRYIDRYPRGCLAAGLIQVAVVWIGLGLWGTLTPLAGALFVSLGLGFSTMIAALMNRALQLSPGSTDIGVATYSTFYNAGIAVGSWVGALVLASASPAPLPWLGAGSLLIALVLLASVNKVAAWPSRSAELSVRGRRSP